MSDACLVYWARARRSLASARILAESDPYSSISRAYYSAFYAVSGWFIVSGRKFKKHAAVEAAVHRDLVREGHWSAETGKAYTLLLNLRYSSDYDAVEIMTTEMAINAIAAAQRVLDAVRQLDPNLFPLD